MSRRKVQPPCSVDNCELPQYAKTFCRPHYSRTLRGIAPEDFKPVRPYSVRRKIPADRVPRNDLDQKLCISCKKYKDEDKFSYDSRRADLKSLYCKPCMRLKTAHLRMSTYGITKAKFNELLKAQNGLCAICQCDITGKTPHGRDKANIDHDHSCCPDATACGNCVRGLLCASCNIGLGGFKDNAVNVRRALSYLAR